MSSTKKTNWFGIALGVIVVVAVFIFFRAMQVIKMGPDDSVELVSKSEVATTNGPTRVNFAPQMEIGQ